MPSVVPATLASTSRRRFLKVAAATTVLGASGTASAQETPTFELDGRIPGWVGQSPDAIAGRTNPILALEAGATYRITWTNVDGRAHNVALLNGDGTVLKRTDIISEQGATQTLTFTATQEMAEYICEVHPTSMRGEIRIAGEQSSRTQTDTSTDSVSVDRFMPEGPTVRLETIVDGGLTAPLDLEVPPDDDRRFVVDQVGQVYALGSDGLADQPFIDISDQLVDFNNLPQEKTIDERGLLGFTFHPEFQDNRKFYLHYSAPPRSGTPEGYIHTQVLAEFRATEDRSEGILDSERTLLEIPQPYYTHNGGAILFGPDGHLYMSMGNGGGDLALSGNVDDWYKNRGGNGQDVTENLLGSILRIDVDNREDDKPYAIPDDNPLVGKTGLDEQYAWGFRNPWRMSFNRGNLFVCDVGQFNYEEVSIVAKGGNYGRNVKEGTHCFGSANLRPITDCTNRTPENVRDGELLIDPIIEYPHTYNGEGVGFAVTGGYLYENATIPALGGKFVFGDYTKTGRPGGSVFAATPPKESQWSLEEVVFEGFEDGFLDSYVLGVYRDALGELYVLTTDNLGVRGETGAVHKIVPPIQETSTPVPTETPERPPTATATPQPTPTSTERPTSAPTTNGPSSGSATATTTETATNADESEGWISGVEGPGLGVFAALAALVSVAVRLITRCDE